MVRTKKDESAYLKCIADYFKRRSDKLTERFII